MKDKQERRKIFSFRRGYYLLPAGKQTAFREKIMAALGLVSRNSFYCRMRGDSQHDMAEAKKIVQIFTEYGIEEKDIWGI